MTTSSPSGATTTSGTRGSSASIAGGGGRRGEAPSLREGGGAGRNGNRFWIGSYEGSNKTGRSKRTAAPTPRHAGAGAGEPSYLTRISLAVNFPPFSM